MPLLAAKAFIDCDRAKAAGQTLKQGSLSCAWTCGRLFQLKQLHFMALQDIQHPQNTVGAVMCSERSTLRALDGLCNRQHAVSSTSQ